ncbi:D-alanyl-D-alanine carboxypeptidase family protein [Chelativorans sp. AA-79]|uniref:D-alanyl-D-alanine carboxypeptidase family protein n=1 Tax=Chelativorans sp. AA-79 TaxID=3028735 RepID=UPI0023F78A06|nr:D-alanyl-D-alanine carboxypeptidase family protein [Chelativorans sp. AA-79]WEX11908.1 D-alanyl-D-alanine carboxypeptidase [Chelativorans sp. AA-79]
MALAIALGPASHAWTQGLETKAAQAFVIDAGTGTVLLSKNPDEFMPPASLAKLMTVELVFHALESGRLFPEEEFPVSVHAWRTGGAPSGTATMFAAVKSSVPVGALIQGITVHQANDACIIIAEAMAGSEENFARLMTERARTIGLQKSTFVNPTGLPADGQQVTPREMALLAQHLLREYPGYYHYFSQPDFEWNRINQRNRLLRLETGADGLGLGFTEGTGYSIIASAARDGRRLVAVLTGIPTEKERVEETRKVLDWGFDAFRKRRLFTEGEVIGEASVYGGAKGSVALRANGPVSALLPSRDSESYSARIVYDGPIPAPVEQGTPVGKLQIWIGDMLSQETELHAAETVPRGTLRQRAFGAVEELLVGWTR